MELELNMILMVFQEGNLVKNMDINRNDQLCISS